MTNTATSSEISSASRSRNVSIHFWRFPDNTFALNCRRATESVTMGPTKDATRAVHAETRLMSREYMGLSEGRYANSTPRQRGLWTNETCLVYRLALSFGTAKIRTNFAAPSGVRRNLS